MVELLQCLLASSLVSSRLIRLLPALTKGVPQLCVAVLLERIDVLANRPRKAKTQPRRYVSVSSTASHGIQLVPDGLV